MNNELEGKKTAYKDIEDLIAKGKEIYSKANTKEELAEYENMFESLFNHLLKDVKDNNTNSNIYKIFIKNKNEKYKQNTPERIVIDYIAGMTDDFFLKEYKKYEN